MEQTKRFSLLWWVTVAVAVLLAVLFAFETPLSAYAEGTEKGKYIKETVMITATSLDDAKAKVKKLNDEGKGTYYLFESPIYDCGGQQTYIAYTTTNNRANAVKSIKTMNMTGGWSYEEYDKYLDDLKDKANFLAEDMYKAITEYVSVLGSGTDNGKYAKKMLEYFKEDDSNKNLSDFFIEMANKGSYENAKEEMTTFVMQANASILSTVETVLLTACADAYKGQDEEDNSFITGMQSQSYLDGLDGFLNNESYAKYDVYVDNILSSLPKVQEDIKFYMNSGYMLEDTVEEVAIMEEEEILSNVSEDSDNKYNEYIEAKEETRKSWSEEGEELELSEEEQEAAKKLSAFDKYYKDLPIADQTRYTNGKIYYGALENSTYTGYFKDGKYEYKNLLGLVMAHDNTEDYKKEDWYPLIHKLTPGQRALLKVGFSQLLYSVTVPSQMLDKTFNLMLNDFNEKAETEEKKIQKGNQVSVYKDIDRSLFQKNSGIALTSDAIRTLKEKPLTHNLTSAEKAGKICDIIAIAAGGLAATTIAAGVGCTTFMYLALKADLATFTSQWNAYNYNLFLGAVRPEPIVRNFLGSKITTDAVIYVDDSFTIQQTFSSLEFAENAPVSYMTSLKAFFRVGFGAVLKWISIVSIGIMIISIAFKYIYPLIAKEGDTPYVNIPRVMCSHEEIFGQKVEEGKDPEKDYIYYYGVKNPFLTKADQDRAYATAKNKPSEDLDVTKYMIGDVCNWNLKGESRQWVAVYASTDKKSGNPILADSLTVLTSSADFNKTENKDLVSVVKFGGAAPFDFQLAYGVTKNKNVPTRYLGYKTDNAAPSQSGSIFSGASLWGGLIAGLVLGGGIGTLITYGVIKKRKKKTA